MERKILWLISFALILILWLKVELTNKTQNKESTNTQASESLNLQDEANESGESTADEKSYFKTHPVTTTAPDFGAIADTNERKKAFFNYLKPFVDEKNALLLEDRKHLLSLLGKVDSLSAKDKNWISDLRSAYRLDKVDTITKSDIKELLGSVDIVPSSLVLAQAANESAWGTSRFAKEGSNYFGQWCFRQGCGLVPESRDEDADHEVRKFDDARESVFAYIDNLNRNAAYKKLRNIRKKLRASGSPVTGMALVHGLDNYSQRGQAYVDEIEGLIEYNKLWRFNTQNHPKMVTN